ncbi:lipopolysaccharide biosynthesis protein [Lachnospiraceae bacterium JLR.KK008]
MKHRTESGLEKKVEGGGNVRADIPADTIRKNMLWNVIGSTGFIGAQWAMTILIVHLAGYAEAGYLSLGLSLTNIFTNIAYFCIRNYQVSDLSGKYDEDIYVTHRVVMTGAALALYLLFVLCNGYGVYVTVFLLLFMVYRLGEPVVDVFHGIDQKAWRLDVAGKSFLLRAILTLLSFIVLEKLTGNLAVTTAVMLVAVYGVIFLYDIPQAYRFASFSLRFDKGALLSLTKECFPLFVYAICLNMVVPIPRYVLEKVAGSEMLGYYASVAIPASVIQLFASYIFTTFTALFSEYVARNEKKKFLSLFGKLTIVIVALVAAALGGCALLGEWVLVLVFTETIRPYVYLLMPTVFCCGIIALIWFMGNVLTVLRDRKGLLLGAAAGTAAVIGVSYPCIIQWGMDGINVALLVSSMTTLVIFGVRFAAFMRRWK